MRSRRSEVREPNPNLRRARRALVVGGVLLAVAAALAVFDATGDGSPDSPPVITGELD
ncbi:MAG: hypothetical protein ACE5GB_12860 [Acidimicrobiales bacterium]